MSQEAASTDITTMAVRRQEEQVDAGQPKEKGEEEEEDVAVEEKIIQVEAEMPELQEVRPQSSEVAETNGGP
jgi:hypothetical protein